MTSSSNAITVAQQEQNETWKDWGGRKYNESYESWMPWAEDQYLKWFGKDNKASYVAKGRYLNTFVTARLRLTLSRYSFEVQGYGR